MDEDDDEEEEEDERKDVKFWTRKEKMPLLVGS